MDLAILIWALWSLIYTIFIYAVVIFLVIYLFEDELKERRRQRGKEN